MSSNAVTKIEFDENQLAVIESQFFPSGATKAEQQYCFAVARELGLNPITREVYFVPRRQKVGDRWVNKVEPMVGRDGFLAIAHKSGQIAGMETSCSIKDVPQMVDGKFLVRAELTAECHVWRKDSSKPFTAQVSYSEYCQRTADGKPTKFWVEKPETMLKKVAESQALRKAFNIHGVYCPEEIGAGFETDSGDIIGQSVEPQYARADSGKSHLTVVVPPQTDKTQQQHAPAPPDPTAPAATTAPTTLTAPAAPPVPAAPEPPKIIEGEVLGQDDEESWPVGSPPEPEGRSEIDNLVPEILKLLDGKKITYEIDMESGIICANSFTHKDILKASGFKWNQDIKSWVFKFEPSPF